MKKKFKIDIWEFVNIEDINNHLESYLNNDLAEDIGYKCLSINEYGELIIEATFKKVKV